MVSWKLETAGGRAFAPALRYVMNRMMGWGISVLVGALLVGCARTPPQPAANQRPAARVAASTKKEKPQPAGQPKGQPDAFSGKIVVQAVRISWQEKGQRSLDATAHEMTGNTADGTASLKKVSARLYSEGKLTATLTAPLVQADENSKTLTATGGVTVTSADPKSSIRVIKADSIRWFSRQNMIVGEGRVKARGPVALIDAAAFTADTRMRTVKVYADPTEARAVIGKH